MPDAEKVIKGLEWCMNEKHDCYREKGCPYENEGEDIGCKYALHRDALALLKAQMPRVMTLEEVEQWSNTHPHKQDPIWVEFIHGRGTDGWRVGLINSGLLAWCKDKEARCWTSRPTDEQRKKEPWNG